MNRGSAAGRPGTKRDVPAPPLTIGLEEEVLLLDPRTFAPAPVAAQALERLGGDPRFTSELPADQLEITIGPAQTVGELTAALAAARRDLATALDGLAVPAAAGVHPTAPVAGQLQSGARYDALHLEFGELARRQQVCALQIHVNLGERGRTVVVHDALRSHLPEIAALAANAPFQAGRDTGLASARPVVCRLLPRQGVPPALGGHDGWQRELAWGDAAGALPDTGRWWWELRPHSRFGTLEVRVPDAQTTVTDAAAIAAFVHALTASLAARHDAGVTLPVHPTWRIEELRWRACRDGVAAMFADLDTGAQRPVHDILTGRLRDLAPMAERLGCDAELADAARLLGAGGGCAAQREIAARAGIGSVPAWLASRYVESVIDRETGGVPPGRATAP